MRNFGKYFLIINCLWGMSCSSDLQPEFIKIDDNLPDEQIDSLHITATNGNFIEYEMTANFMSKFYDKKQTFIKNVFIIFFNEDKSIKSTLRCDTAELDDIENTLTGIGNVIIKSETGKMKAPRIVLNRNNNILHATEGVILIRDNNILHGKKMISDLNLEHAEITEVSAEGELTDEKLDW
ncbi:MAG: LPS export ABC transporter periplasmic protein LptC [Candidatus Cloacimonetes bacterium]|jgi:LPS export ABC transporter protein LptC|nr:LPS export ABC transporter periplasmic protein LptC [Candidatus Cloacimonadota bacterium]MBT6994247.1 LPS export ABC transporter periplasmic protein LptC [Candidatus Cloacimonadota bacterium]MBT7470019.1 LPS export ABC transporter periplasmic protein LptC [Candidatus Cloacimonadota bacterium]